MSKTIMIVGAGFGQVPAIEKAKDLGYQVIAIDKNPDAIGMSKADISLAVDIIDIKEVVNVAKEYNIDGIMTMQSDIAVPGVGAVVDALSLNGVGLIVANRCSNKIEARELFEKANVPQPDFRVIDTLQEALVASKLIGYPCVIKAPDSSGSRGITKVNNESEVLKAFDEGKKYSRIGKLLVEDFVDGEEIGAQAFSRNGKCIKVLVHNDTISNPPFMIPTGHSFPSFLSDEIRLIAEKACKNAVEAIGISSGPSNIDLILSKDGTPMIIEIGARIGATCLPELVKYHTGIDWVEQTIKSCLGEDVDLTNTKDEAVAALILESPQDGVLKSFTAPDTIRNSSVLEWEMTAVSLDEVHKLRKGTDRIGKIIVIAENVKEAEAEAMKIKSKFQYKIDEK